MKEPIEAKRGKGKGKAKAIKETALEAGLAAFAALESTDVVPRPVTITARTLVREGIESIMRARDRGVPLLRIYTDAKRAAGLKIGFQTFAGYVSEAARDKGLKLEKVKTAPRMPASTSPAQVQDQGQEKSGWNCDACQGSSQRHESTKYPGRYYWRCSSCGQAYADNHGTMTDRKM